MSEWEKQEKGVAARRGGSRQPGSGSSWRRPNDVRESKVLWEMKSTGKKQITIKLTDWDKLEMNALTSGVTPALHIQIGTRRLVIISEEDFDERFPAE